MYKIICMLLLMIGLVIGQEARRWGNELDIGRVFTNTDSTELRSTVITLVAGETYYTEMLGIAGDEGAHNFSFYGAAVSGSPTITLSYRLYHKHAPALKHYNNWIVFGTALAADTWHNYSLGGDWAPRNGIQYKVDIAVANVTPYISDYLK